MTRLVKSQLGYPHPVNIEDVSALKSYLAGIGVIDPHEVIHVQVLAGGVSNRTVLVRHPPRRAWVLKQALPKLRVEVDWFSSPERIHREALGLRLLRKLLGHRHVPALVFEDRQNHVLAMHAVPHPHENWKQRLLSGRIEANLVAEFARMLANIHIGAWQQAETWQPLLSDKHFFETLRLEPYYGYTATQVKEAAPFLQSLITQTRSLSVTAVHGDYSPKNVLIRSGRLILLDHEVLHWGDPAFDLGFALTHLLSKAHYVASQREAYVASAHLFWRRYRDHVRSMPWWRGLSARAARHLMGCLLARVAGRSPLEYLSPQQRRRQLLAVLDTLSGAAQGVDQVIDRFMGNIQRWEEK